MAASNFTFEISLSVLNHLGRNLYRSFGTVLGEAISNAWDADARNVWIEVDRQKGRFLIKDDGTGMTAADFQDKFLKIGYSKRRTRSLSPKRKRPFIGRKGIGKLALLSCADKITVVSRVKGGDYVGGEIDNSGLDRAITQDLRPQEYALGPWKPGSLRKHMKGHSQGTIIKFEGVREGVRSSFDSLRKTIALYFRFSLLDSTFSIYLNGEKITYKHLDDLAEKTEFLWEFRHRPDPYIAGLKARFKQAPKKHRRRSVSLPGAYGFIASVSKPSELKIRGTEDRVSIDLFVNGRLRESDILKHVPTTRVVESYLYGQIHFNDLDDEVDRFTSSREGIVADDPKFKAFLTKFKALILKVVDQWDEWRTELRKEGDSENPRLDKKDRASIGLYGAVAGSYTPSKGAKGRGKVEAWVEDLGNDATFNFGSYAECFVSENLIRQYIREKKLALSQEAINQAEKWKAVELNSMNKGNLSIKVRRHKSDLSYLDMGDLAKLADKGDLIKDASLVRDAMQYKPIRDAVAHTALLTDQAKARMTGVHENIKGRVKTLLGRS